MYSSGRSRLLVLAGFTLTLAGASVHASTTTYFSPQGPKVDLTSATPPALTSVTMAQIAAFNSAVTVLGNQEFETGLRNFSYTGGTATLSAGTATVKDGNSASTDLTVGRYNTTPNLPPNPNTLTPDFGKWLEASADFRYSFSGSPVSAFAFFGTDFSDFVGGFSLEFLSGGNQVYTSGSTIVPSGDNGNLLFFGASSTVAFDTVVFHIQQRPGATSLDVFGFDSFIVGRTNSAGGTVPEPTSLALVGLALLTAGWARKGKQAA